MMWRLAFPTSFVVVKDRIFNDLFVIAFRNPGAFVEFVERVNEIAEKVEIVMVVFNCKEYTFNGEGLVENTRLTSL